MRFFSNKFSFKLLGNFILRGIFIVSPLFFTGFALFKLFTIIDSPIQNIFYHIFGFRIYGLGVLSTLLILLIAGYLGTNIIMENIFRRFEKILFKIPLVKEIYKSLRDIIGAFASDKKKFEKPVLIEVHDKVFRIGFVTNDSLISIGIEDLVSVYFPFSYAFTGELMLVHSSKLRYLRPDQVGDLMKFVISGGIVDTEEADIIAK